MQNSLIRVKAVLVALAMTVASATGSTRDLDSSFASGRLALGCNYWASHAGVYMWRDWRPEQVERDFARMAENGVSIVRVFPLWPDFQPLTTDRAHGNSFVGYLQADQPLQNEAGVDDEMIGRFRFLCSVAERHRIRLIVGLVTGWMSGRMFAPPAFDSAELLRSPEVIMWQSRFVRYFVKATKDCPAILAWDLGNECNCLGTVTGPEMWVWFHAIVSEIRQADSTRPVVSGLHSATTKRDGQVTFRQLSELMDVVTTHPYPLWTPNCNLEMPNSLRNACHAPCETTLYGNLTRRCAIVEEAGSLGPTIASEENAAAMMRMQLFGSWAAGIPMYLWWCAFDQNLLPYSPYERNHVERELGLFTASGEPKVTVREFAAFNDFLKSLPFERLPARQVDAVVLLPEDEDAWEPAQGAWMLARQAGFDVAYAHADDRLPEASFYILPSGSSLDTYRRSAWLRVADKVRDEGGTLLVTLGNGSLLSELPRIAGIETLGFYQQPRTVRCEVEGESLSFEEPRTRRIRTVGAVTLVADSDGHPLLTEFACGKGKVLFCNAAVETNAQLVGWPIYRMAARRAGVQRRVSCAASQVGLSEHPFTDGRTVVVAVNHGEASVKTPVEIKGKVGRVFRGEIVGNELSIGGNDAAVFEVLVTDK